MSLPSVKEAVVLQVASGGHMTSPRGHFPVGRVCELHQWATPTWRPGGGGVRVQGSRRNLTQGWCKASLSVLYHCVCMCVCTCVHARTQSGPTVGDPMDCSPPGSSLHGNLQARILEWVAMPSSRGSSRSRDQTCASCVSCIAGRFFTEPPEAVVYFCQFLT